MAQVSFEYVFLFAKGRRPVSGLLLLRQRVRLFFSVRFWIMSCFFVLLCLSIAVKNKRAPFSLEVNSINLVRFEG
jgi:hypothetical protein